MSGEKRPRRSEDRLEPRNALDQLIPPKPPADMTVPELNAAVAVEVMGWRMMSDISGLRFYEDRDNIMHDPDWSPATDIAAAFEVVERMRERGWVFNLGDEFPHVFARFHRRTELHRAVVDMKPNSEARAISLAALAAVRSET